MADPPRGPRRGLIELGRKAFHLAGIEVSRHVPNRRFDWTPSLVHQALIQLQPAYSALRESDAEAFRFLSFCASRLEHSRSQLLQDLFVLFTTGTQQPGYFVEFGAADGVALSNTHLLETRHGWRGILAEPARCWHEGLRRGRSCHVSTDCVWHTSGQTLEFAEVSGSPELSTLSAHANGDGHAGMREGASHYAVTTVSLNDLLLRFEAPHRIDYLSVDTEGSEFEILRAFDFARHDVRCITVEHNGTPRRESIRQLLLSHGFERKFESLSGFDDWYVKQSG